MELKKVAYLPEFSLLLQSILQHASGSKNRLFLDEVGGSEENLAEVVKFLESLGFRAEENSLVYDRKCVEKLLDILIEEGYITKRAVLDNELVGLPNRLALRRALLEYEDLARKLGATRQEIFDATLSLIGVSRNCLLDAGFREHIYADEVVYRRRDPGGYVHEIEVAPDFVAAKTYKEYTLPLIGSIHVSRIIAVPPGEALDSVLEKNKKQIEEEGAALKKDPYRALLYKSRTCRQVKPLVAEIEDFWKKTRDPVRTAELLDKVCFIRCDLSEEEEELARKTAIKIFSEMNREELSKALSTIISMAFDEEVERFFKKKLGELTGLGAPNCFMGKIAIWYRSGYSLVLEAKGDKWFLTAISTDYNDISYEKAYSAIPEVDEKTIMEIEGELKKRVQAFQEKVKTYEKVILEEAKKQDIDIKVAKRKWERTGVELDISEVGKLIVYPREVSFVERDQITSCIVESPSDLRKLLREKFAELKSHEKSKSIHKI